MKGFKDILCVAGTESDSQFALERAAALAENNQATVTLVAVAEQLRNNLSLAAEWPFPDDPQAALVNALQQQLEQLAQPYRSRVKVNTRVLTGTTAFLAIIREVLRSGHDLVVKSIQSAGLLKGFSSGEDMHLLRKCPSPVWLVKPDGEKSYRRILAAVDVDENYPADELQTRQALNELVLEMAGSLALSEFAELHVVCAWEAVGEDALRHSAFMKQPSDKVDDYVEKVRQRHARQLEGLITTIGAKMGTDAMDYITPQVHLVKGSPRKEIPLLTKRLKMDCVVMGTVARTGVRGLIMGNTAETILKQLDCSVLALKPPGFVAPVTI